MKTILQLSVPLILLQSMAAKAQQTVIYGLAKKTAAVKEVYFSTVDPVTGTVSIISNPYITNHIIVDGATLDNVNNLYYYFSPGTITNNLNAVDIFSGNISYYAPLAFPAGFYFDLIQYNCKDSAFYGFYRNSTLSQLQMARINVNTGLVTTLSAVPMVASFSDDYTYDKKNGIFYYIVSNYIQAVSLQNGLFLNVTPVVLPAGEYFENIEFNCNDSSMYGTYRNSSGMRFAKVNLITGILTVLSSASFAAGYGSGRGHILDEDEGRYYFNTSWDIITIDISNGTVINSAPLIYSQPGTFNLYYIKKSLDCNCSNAVSVAETNIVNHFNSFPNPVTAQFNFQTNNNQLSLITVYDLTSRKLLHKEFTNSVSLNMQQLAKGIYLYEVKSEDGLIKKGKIVKE